MIARAYAGAQWRVEYSGSPPSTMPRFPKLLLGECVLLSLACYLRGRQQRTSMRMM